MNHYTRIIFKYVSTCILLLSLTTKLFSQDTTKLRLERWDSLLIKLNELRPNIHTMISLYKKYKLITSETFTVLKTKAEQFDQLLKNRSFSDRFNIRRLGDNYDDLTQGITSIYDSVHPSTSIPKTKNVIKQFFESYFKAEAAISNYDDLNGAEQDLLFRRYHIPTAQLI